MALGSLPFTMVVLATLSWPLATLGAPAVTRMRSNGATSLQPMVPSNAWILTFGMPSCRMRWIA